MLNAQLAAIFCACFSIMSAFVVSAKTNELVSARHICEMDLKQAVDNNLVQIKITGVDMPGPYCETVDQEGLHFGKCMAITITSGIDSPIIVRLNCGTLLMPNENDVQIMVATHDVSFELKGNESCATKFYAMCTQMHLFAPTIDESFTVGKMADTTLMRLAKYLETNYDQNLIGQHAVWAYTDTASVAQLKEYGADDYSIAKTIAILNDANVFTDLNKRPDASGIARITPRHIYGYLIYLFAAVITGALGYLTYSSIKVARRIRYNDGLIARLA